MVVQALPFDISSHEENKHKKKRWSQHLYDIIDYHTNLKSTYFHLNKFFNYLKNFVEEEEIWTAPANLSKFIF